MVGLLIGQALETQKVPEKPFISYDDFAKLDLRVATVVAAEAHPNADRLLKLQIQVDPGGGSRQICAGIRQYYEPQDLVGKQIVVVTNLEPRTIRGEVSAGMLLAATATDGDEIRDVVVLEPTRACPAGASVG